ncbi:MULTISPECIES: sulfatase-like hydrolase/transferase [unclassified Streptomyces]|uniref:sulfatase-like hydrolase/transferase n=1 Tax=unclassified Streptomyces TaxID=2593676 RepID=UPI002DDAAD97|nr:sulfatase-like hydrolase/transferase [Streptomyces sp. NBC_01445]WSE03021.1 sulfatase-like hydrolase/transferase [Streptomyces sp. NBC_01445]
MSTRTARPNFLILMPDQLRADALGAFGNVHADTPHLDALAARGTRFSNAYVQHPVCSPSRASILTGWYPHTAGHRTLTHLLKDHEPNLLRILKDAGYHVTWAGMRGDTFAPGVTESSVDEYGFSTWPTRLYGGDYPEGVWSRLFYRGRVPDDGGIDFDEAAVRTAEQWLREPPRDRPWVLFVPLVAPHCPFQVEEPWFSRFDRGAVPDPAPPGDPSGEPRYLRAVREAHGLDEVTPEQWREVVATYYGMVSRLDDQIGRISRAVEQAGAADDTVTLFFADHGEYLGDHGVIEKWPSAMHDCITRDPLIISGAGLGEGGRECDAMVEMVDVLPTVLDLAGVPAPHRHFGRSLLPLLRDPSAPHRELAFTEGGFTVDEEPQMERADFPYDLKSDLQHQDPTLVGKAVAARDQEWTYVWRLYEQPELYHRAEDPHERTNLAGRPEHADVERRLHDAVLRWLVETSDVIPADPDPRRPDVALPAPAAPARS